MTLIQERVPAFLHWALLSLQRAGTESPTPVRLTLLAAGEPDLAAQVNAWDLRYCATDAAGACGHGRRPAPSPGALWSC